MKSYKIAIPRPVLHAVALFAGKGTQAWVMLDAREPVAPVLVATDGRAQIAFHASTAEILGVEGAPSDCWLPAGVYFLPAQDALAAREPAPFLDWRTYEAPAAGGYDLRSFWANNWRQVMPKEGGAPMQQVNIGFPYLAKIAKVAGLLYQHQDGRQVPITGVSVRAGSDEAAPVAVSLPFYGNGRIVEIAVMPIRMN